jgi:hypothetical protein
MRSTALRHASDVRCNMANENMNIIGAGQDTARRAAKEKKNGLRYSRFR